MMRTFEKDESYFGAKRVRGKRGRGTAGKKWVFGLLKRREKAFTQDCFQLFKRSVNAYKTKDC